MKNNTLKYRVGEVEKDVREIKTDMKQIRTNELPHMTTKIEKIATDVCWLKKAFWIVATASIGGFIGQLWSLFR